MGFKRVYVTQTCFHDALFSLLKHTSKHFLFGLSFFFKLQTLGGIVWMV